MLAFTNLERAAFNPAGHPRRATAATSEPRVLNLHLSAVISGVTYFTGVVLAALQTPEMALEIAFCGRGAVVLLGAFAAFMMLAVVIQRQMGISLASSETATPPKLCTGGAFAYSRNPIYLIFAIPLLAIGYFSFTAALIATALYTAAITTFVIRGEESALTKMFGEEYKSYCRRTPRWIGCQPRQLFTRIGT